MLHWIFLLGLWKGSEVMPDLTPTTQCNTNNPAALAQNSTGANLHQPFQILYGHNSCDKKEKAHSFFSSWSILGYISFLRCKETCLVLGFFTKWVGRREKESSGTFEILFYKELGKLTSCSCSNLANFPSSNELKEYSLNSWNQHSVVPEVHHWSNKAQTLKYRNARILGHTKTSKMLFGHLCRKYRKLEKCSTIGIKSCCL